MDTLVKDSARNVRAMCIMSTFFWIPKHEAYLCVR